jgi:hypothetical protein
MRVPGSSQPAWRVGAAREVTFDGSPPVGGSESASGRAALLLRLRVFVARGRLDRQIVAGRPCESSAALALRARQLTDPRTRRRIANDLRGIVDYVHRRGSRRVISAVVIEPAAVRTGRQAILELARRLEGTARVSPSGVVLAAALLTDGRSPLFSPHSERTVAPAVSEVHDALEGLPIVEFDALAALPPRALRQWTLPALLR